MKIVGVDQSLRNTGLATIERGVFISTGRVSTEKMNVKGHSRIDVIIDEIMRTVGDTPSASVRVGIEGPAMSAKGSAVVQIFGLYGILCRELYLAGLRYYVVTPQSVKQYATGKGNASKDEVLAAMIRRHPEVDFFSNDIADAMAVAAIGARKFADPVEDSLPKRAIEALDKVQWDHQG